MKTFLAIDLGASSGRHIVGWLEDDKVQTREMYRFQNRPILQDGHWIWDIDQIVEEVIKGLEVCLLAYPNIVSLAIDSWGVDSVRIQNGKRSGPCFCYRDGRTQNVIELVHDRIPFEELYSKTGIQFQAFNSIYQWMDDHIHQRLDDIDAILMIPEYINYRLTGIIKHEYTNASTSGLVNLKSKQYDSDLIKRLGFPSHLFQPLHQAGTVLGSLTPEIQALVKGNTKVILCASHDTASAFESIDLDESSVLLSSGTWSLMGIKQTQAILSNEARSLNFTHEGGVNTLRILKNIMGLWIINQLREQFHDNVEINEEELNHRQYPHIFDVNDPRFIKPESMATAIQSWFVDHAIEAPSLPSDLLMCAYHSLVESYKNTLKELEIITNRSFKKLIIIGGGAKDERLNQMTRNALDIEVITYPIEATAIGNLKIQIQKENIS